MAELKLIYDDGYGAKTERTITSFSDPRNDYADCGGDPTWQALLMECWHFLNGLGYVISKQEQDYVDDYLFYGPHTDAEKCSGCCNGNCEHCQCEKETDETIDIEEPIDESIDRECSKCALNDTCESLNSRNCPMEHKAKNEKIGGSKADTKYDIEDIEDMITDILERYETKFRPPYKVTC
jgi:hypothetical protein